MIESPRPHSVATKPRPDAGPERKSPQSPAVRDPPGPGPGRGSASAHRSTVTAGVSGIDGHWHEGYPAFTVAFNPSPALSLSRPGGRGKTVARRLPVGPPP